MDKETFDLWCLVELFGHQKIAGRCTEQNIAGTNMLRVDVPETSKNPSFTRLFGSAAIYAINPIDEVSARAIAERLEVAPIIAWQADEAIQKYKKQLPEGNNIEKIPAGRHEEDDPEAEWNNDDE